VEIKIKWVPDNGGMVVVCL